MGTSARALTVRDAAILTGLTEKALRRRIERGVLPSVLGHDGRRRVPTSALRSAGLIPQDGAPTGPIPPAGAPSGEAFSELLGRLETLAAENGRLRALTDGHERRERELEAELHKARARVLELEARVSRRRWFRFKLSPA